MKAQQSDMLIIGGGLTGLLLANLLQSIKANTTILEARPRLGGRIFTKNKAGFPPQEMGATWLSPPHTAMMQLLEQLGIGTFEQKHGGRAIYEAGPSTPAQLVSLPPNSDPSYRIKGGSSTLIDKLSNNLNTEQILTNQIVISIEKEGDYFSVKTTSQEFKSKIVVSTLPPFLLTSIIKISPALPDSLLAIAKQTHTWMGESIKVSLSYKTAFWRAENLSGIIFSNVGPIPEMYDHSNFEDNAYALKGFFNPAYFSTTKEERLDLALQQLEKYYGQQARDYLTYEEVVWRKEIFTFADYQMPIVPHQNNGHTVFQQSFFDGTFYLAGAETANYSPGYMEGAVRSAQNVFQQILQGGLVC